MPQPAPPAPPPEVEAYLQAQSPAAQEQLRALRAQILALRPKAVEGMSYGMPAIRLHGKAVAGYQATRQGASYYPHSGQTLDQLGAALAGFGRTKSALHLPKETTLPEALLALLLDTREAEILAGLKRS